MSSEHKDNRLQHAHSPGKPKQKKRAQVRLACTNCRKAHACCDETRPCKRCVKNNLGASCLDLPRRRRTAGSKKSDEHDEISSSTSSLKKKRHSTSDDDEEGDAGWNDDTGFIQPQPASQEIYPTMSTSGTQQLMADTMVAPTNNIPNIDMIPMENCARYASSSYSTQYSPSTEYSNGNYIQPQTQIKYEPRQVSPQNQCYYPQSTTPPWRGDEQQQANEQNGQLMRARSPDLVHQYNNGNYYNPSPRLGIFPHRVPVFENYKNSGYPTAIWTFNTRLLVDCNKPFEDLIVDHCKLDQNSIVRYKNFLHSGKFSCFDLFPTYFLPYANECYTNLITEISATDKSLVPAENAHEMVFKRPDGGEISVLVTCTPIFGANKQHPGCPQVTHYVMQIIRLQSMPARPKATAIKIEPYESPIHELPAQDSEAPLDQFNNLVLNDNSMQYESNTPNQYYGQQQLSTPNGYVTQQQLPTDNGAYNAFEDPNVDYSSFLDPQTPNNQQYYNGQYFQNMIPLS
jgi:hypothetical protein